MQKATFGAGCFWQVEDTFRRVKGIIFLRASEDHQQYYEKHRLSKRNK